MDIGNMSIEKATERCKALTNPEHGCWIGISNQKAIETVLEELEHKTQLVKLMVLAILNYDDQLVINKYKDINDVKETFEEILKEG